MPCEKKKCIDEKRPEEPTHLFFSALLIIILFAGVVEYVVLSNRII